MFKEVFSVLHICTLTFIIFVIFLISVESVKINLFRKKLVEKKICPEKTTFESVLKKKFVQIFSKFNIFKWMELNHHL